MPLFTFFFFFNDTATTEIYTLSLHDALPISFSLFVKQVSRKLSPLRLISLGRISRKRSEEHTSELQSQSNLVCRLLLEKKNKSDTRFHPSNTHSGTFHALRVAPLSPLSLHVL